MVSDDIRERIGSYIREQATKSADEIAHLVGATQDQFLSTIDGVDANAAATKPDGDEWSLRDLIRHVILGEETFTSVVETLARGDAPGAGALASAGTVPDDDGRTLTECVGQLRGANARMLDAIRGMPAPRLCTATAVHPVLGPLNCAEWAVAQRIHDVDHIQHAGKIIAKVGFLDRR